jgi:hypothetical protein
MTAAALDTRRRQKYHVNLWGKAPAKSNSRAKLLTVKGKSNTPVGTKWIILSAHERPCPEVNSNNQCRGGL